MSELHMDELWMLQLLPQGLPLETSTLITGPERADNLLVSRSSKAPFRLFLRVERMQGVVFSPEEIEAPITAETLEDVKVVADHSRKRVIPLISRI